MMAGVKVRQVRVSSGSGSALCHSAPSLRILGREALMSPTARSLQCRRVVARVFRVVAQGFLCHCLEVARVLIRGILRYLIHVT